ncbi:MAG: FMN reductase [Rhodospirillales bacterium 20-64-7]|nr:MAG: FMN reductase [Rhodospirillales bacterium 20-64-7]
MSETVSADRPRYREAMSRLGAAVNIITTHDEAGDSGLTASAVCSVTDDPPTLLKQAGLLCVNVLTHEHQELSPIFAGEGNLPMAARFAMASWTRLITGAPALTGAAASLDCKIDQITEVGTHSVFFCVVRAIQLGAASSGLIYHGRTYHKISTEP